MERAFVRTIIVVALVFLLAGDLVNFSLSTLQMMGISTTSGTQEGKDTGEKTTKKKTEFNDDGIDEYEALNMIETTLSDQRLPKAGNQDKEKSSGKQNRPSMEGPSQNTKSSLMATFRNSCIPKLICELIATPHRERLTESERSLLGLIRDTSISTTAEVTSKYHFAAHMGQLIAGIEGTGCHNFYPGCPLPGLQVLQMMKKVKTR